MIITVEKERQDPRETAVCHIPRDAQISEHFLPMPFPNSEIKALVTEFRILGVDFLTRPGKLFHEIRSATRKIGHTGPCPGFVVPESHGARWEIRRGHKEVFPHLFKVQQPVGIPLAKYHQTVKTERAHMMHVQTTSHVLRSPRVGNATMKSRLCF